MKQKHFINSQKLMTAFVVLALMAIYDQWQNPTAWIYLALHGTYGFLWLMKSRIFPDLAWEQKTSLLYGLAIWSGLSLYWIAAWLLMARSVQAPGWYLAMCVSMYAFGVFAHFSSDMQKYVALQLNPDQLITGGMFARLRNTNYFGELLIYLGFTLLAMHWLPILVLLIWIAFVWLPRMYQKDRVLSGYPEFSSYKSKSKLFIPFLY